ncbi:MAG TPA: CoA-binding protein, partial [Terriglobales bacterium]|nr:CoA-binding protein [Terriglobales bacterium]
MALPCASDPIRELLERSKTIAVVGLSNSPLRPSHGVSAYMQTHGYRIIPVNPNIKGALGEKAYPSLLEVPERIDIV